MKILFIILFTFINYPIFGQLKTNIIPKENNINLFSEYNSTNDTVNKNDNIKDKLFNIDINSICLSLSYAKRIKESKWFIGGGGGLALNHWGLLYEWPTGYTIWTMISRDRLIFRDYGIKKGLEFTREFIHLEGLAIFLVSDHFMLVTGIRVGLKEIGIRKGGESESLIFYFPGLYVIPTFGWRNFKIGVLIEATPPVMIYFSPLIRITLYKKKKKI